MSIVNEAPDLLTLLFYCTPGLLYTNTAMMNVVKRTAADNSRVANWPHFCPPFGLLTRIFFSVDLPTKQVFFDDFLSPAPFFLSNIEINIFFNIRKSTTLTLTALGLQSSYFPYEFSLYFHDFFSFRPIDCRISEYSGYHTEWWEMNNCKDIRWYLADIGASVSMLEKMWNHPDVSVIVKDWKIASFDYFYC